MKKVILVVLSICLCLAVFGTAALGETEASEKAATTEQTAAAEKAAEELLQAGKDAYKAKDYAKALEYYEQAAEQGSAEALRRDRKSVV